MRCLDLTESLIMQIRSMNEPESEHQLLGDRREGDGPLRAAVAAAGRRGRRRGRRANRRKELVLLLLGEELGGEEGIAVRHPDTPNIYRLPTRLYNNPLFPAASGVFDFVPILRMLFLFPEKR